MRKSVAIARKDLSAYWHSWMGVLIFVFFYIVSGVFFTILVSSYAKISWESSQKGVPAEGLSLTQFVFGSFFLNISIVLIFLVPVLCMRSFSEEKKMQTLELLFTYPLSDFAIVWGKFLGLIWFYALLLLPTLVYVVLIQWLGGSYETGPLFSSYLGFFLLGCAYFSAGLFVSSMTENQVVSSLATFSLLVLFWMMDWAATVADGFWASFFSALSPLTHYREFTLGIIDLSNIAYFVFFQLYFLFLSIRSIETRNWKG